MKILINEINETVIGILSEAKKWQDQLVKNPETGHMVKVSSLPPEEKEKYKPASLKMKQASTKKKKKEYNIAKQDDDRARSLTKARVAARRAEGVKTESNGQYGVRWTEFDNKDRLVTKEKFFKSEKEREKFSNKLEKKDNFNEFVAWSDPS